ncbi:MAG: GxxExxY protein [bacterium]|nr:GxxExxY protein [bacterium]
MGEVEKIIHKELSYRITGILFRTHRELGRMCRERQYGDLLETLLKESKLEYEREKALPMEKLDRQNTNVVDFCIDNKILLDLKAKPFVTKEDFYQMRRYLEAAGYNLGLIVNFRNTYLKPIRVINTVH